MQRTEMKSVKGTKGISNPGYGIPPYVVVVALVCDWVGDHLILFSPTNHAFFEINTCSRVQPNFIAFFDAKFVPLR